jgi:DNA-binding transcriptional LysR family regulator
MRDGDAWSPLADVTSLVVFVSCAELGSLTRAAEKHGLSQPAVSNRIAQLERRLGITLLQRGPTGSAVTEAGTRLLPWARRVVEAAWEFEVAADGIVAVPPARLAIVASSFAGDHLLPRWIRALGSVGPKVAVTVRNSPEALAMVRQGAAELGVLCVPALDTDAASGLEVTVLGRDELVVVVRPDHRWAEMGSALGVRELAAAELVEREPQSETRAYLDSVLRPFRPHRLPAPLVELSATGALKAAVLDGVGPSILGRLSVTGELLNGRLVAVPVEGFAAARNVFAVWRSRTALSEQAQHFLRYVSSPEAREAVGMGREVQPRLGVGGAGAAPGEQPGQEPRPGREQEREGEQRPGGEHDRGA